MTSTNSKKRIVWSDLLILFVFFLIVFFMFLRSARSNSLYNSCTDSKELQIIIEQETKFTFLDNQSKVSWFSSSLNSLLNYLSSYSFSNNILLYFNPRYPLSVNCSSCYETEPCEEDRIEPYFYPKQITLSALNTKIKKEPDLRYHFLLIQESNENQANVSLPVTVVSLFQLSDSLSAFSKEDTIFVLGSSYLETKVASEALVRNGYKRVYRVMTLLNTKSKGTTP